MENQEQNPQGQAISIEQGDAMANQLFTKASAIKQDVVNALKAENTQLRKIIANLQSQKSATVEPEKVEESKEISFPAQPEQPENPPAQ